MKKKIIIIIGLLLIVSVVFLMFIKNTDAIKFKREYESLNGKDNIRDIHIDKNNNVVYSNANEIINKINNKDTFVVYFGFAKCPWCRSVLPTLLETSKKLKLDKIYYVDVFDIRDTLEVKNGKVITKTKGTKEYYELLKKLDNVLSDYTLEGATTNEKRIYAPNIIAIANGKAKMLETGISDKQTDGYMTLTKEMKKDMEDKVSKVIKVVTNSETCSLKNKGC